MNDCKCKVAGSTAFRIVDFDLPCPLCGKPEPVSETDPKLSDTEMLLKVNAQPLIQQNLIKGCKHIEVGIVQNDDNELQATEFTYCPKCGEKL